MERTVYYNRDGHAVEINPAASEIVRGADRGNDMIELDNGVWLRSMRDGRFYEDGNNLNAYAEVTTGEWELDEDTNEYCLISGTTIGYIAI